jgi:uncharacterized membrane protein
VIFYDPTVPPTVMTRQATPTGASTSTNLVSAPSKIGDTLYRRGEVGPTCVNEDSVDAYGEMNGMLFQTVLMLATFLCSLVAGFLLAFAVVVMPGIRSLDDGDFIRAFQVIDRVIQNGQPVFMFVWAGSALAMMTAAGLGLWTLNGADRLLLILAALVYLFCVQLPTVRINVPLNNQLRKLNVATMSEPTRKQARSEFEPRWNQWNSIRTACASVASILLILLLLRV